MAVAGVPDEIERLQYTIDQIEEIGTNRHKLNVPFMRACVTILKAYWHLQTLPDYVRDDLTEDEYLVSTGLRKANWASKGEALSGENTRLVHDVFGDTGRVISTMNLDDLARIIEAAREQGREEGDHGYIDMRRAAALFCGETTKD